MNTLLDQLNDIDGLDPISPWPLGLGWWIVIGFAVVLFALAIFFGLRRVAFKRSWKNDTLKKLAELEKNLSEATAKETVIALSEYLRRITLVRFPREEVAGLTGQPWLCWLTKHDPKEFDWQAKGSIIIDLPYAPPGMQRTLSAGQIQELLQAAKNWVV
ncbi:MAG: DUF4381 domain-containing protein [Chlamydiae bacterium]|nr:DUF4381 domain-containing protein [Chlamydiota bacterium]